VPRPWCARTCARSRPDAIYSYTSCAACRRAGAFRALMRDELRPLSRHDFLPAADAEASKRVQAVLALFGAARRIPGRAPGTASGGSAGTRLLQDDLSGPRPATATRPPCYDGAAPAATGRPCARVTQRVYGGEALAGATS
jgi:hypothetical protein